MKFLLLTFFIGITVTSGQPLCRTYASFPTYKGECAENELKLFNRCVEREFRCQTTHASTEECNLCYQECIYISLLVSNHKNRRYRLRKAAFRCKNKEEKSRIQSCEQRRDRCSEATRIYEPPLTRLEICENCARDCMYQMKFLSDSHSRALHVIETADRCVKLFWNVCKMYEEEFEAVPPLVCTKKLIDYEFNPPLPPPNSP